MPDDPSRSTTAQADGLLASLRTLGATLVSIIQTRLELLGCEVDEERVRVQQMLLFGAAALFCGMMAVLLLTFLIVIVFWDTQRVAVLLVLIGAYSTACLAAVTVLRSRAAEKSRLFSQSLAELGKDRELLKTR